MPGKFSLTDGVFRTYLLCIMPNPSIHKTPIWGRSLVWARIIAMLLIVVSLAAFLVYVFQHFSSGFDDAYMFIRYANNFRNGHEIAWNPGGEQTYGVTSLAYFAVVTLVKTLLPGIANGTLLVLVSTLAIMLAVMLLAGTCARFARAPYLSGARILWAGLVFPLLLFSPTVRAHAVTGMDTTLAVLGNTFLIYAALRWKTCQTKFFLGMTVLAAYLTYLTRPESLVYAVLFPILVIGLLMPRKRKCSDFLAFSSLLAGVLVVDTLWKYWLFGDPLPLAFYVKAHGFYDGYIGVYLWNPIPFLFEFGKVALPFLLIACVCLTRESWALLAVFGIPVLIMMGYYFSVLQIMGYHARYYIPSLPFLVIGAGLLLDRALTKGFHAFAEEQRAVKILRGLTITGLVLLFVRPGLEAALTKIYALTGIPEPTHYTSHVTYTTSANTYFPAAGWIRTGPAMAEMLAQFPTGTVVSLSEYGLVGATAAQVQILDPLGLHDRQIAHHGFSADNFLAHRPDFIWFPHPHYTKIVASVLDSPEFWSAYDFYPDLFDYGVAIRKDSAHFAILHKAFSAACQQYYNISDIRHFLAIPDN